MQAFAQSLVVPIGFRNRQNRFDDFGQFLGEFRFRHVAGSAARQGLHGNIFTAVRRH